MCKEFCRRICSELKIIKYNWVKIVILSIINFYFVMAVLKNLGLYYFVSREHVVFKDIGHYLLPEVYSFSIHDIPQSIVWAICLTSLVYVPIFPIFHKHKIYSLKIFIIASYYCSLIYLIRFVSILITALPDPSHECRFNLMPRPQNLHGKNIIKFKIYKSQFLISLRCVL